MARFVILLGVTLGSCLSGSLPAGTILQPSGVTVQPPLTEDRPGVNLINQSGLSSGYTSLVDDFDTYLAAVPAHADRVTGKWQTATGFTLPGDLDFDLGGEFNLLAMALWNADDRNAIDRFTLLADDNPAFSSPDILGDFVALQIVTPQLFAFSPTAASHVRMTITAANGDRVRTGEVAFHIANVPLSGDVLGDIDGDGSVGFADFLILSANFGRSVELGTNGDLDADGNVGFPDFLILSSNFGQPAVASVPEPSGLVLLLWGVMASGVIRQRRQLSRKWSFAPVEDTPAIEAVA